MRSHSPCASRERKKVIAAGCLVQHCSVFRKGSHSLRQVQYPLHLHLAAPSTIDIHRSTPSQRQLEQDGEASLLYTHISAQTRRPVGSRIRPLPLSIRKTRYRLNVDNADVAHWLVNIAYFWLPVVLKRTDEGTYIRLSVNVVCYVCRLITRRKIVSSHEVLRRLAIVTLHVPQTQNLHVHTKNVAFSRVVLPCIRCYRIPTTSLAWRILWYVSKNSDIRNETPLWRWWGFVLTTGLGNIPDTLLTVSLPAL